MRVGINGFGRIGKAIFRINNAKKYFDVVAINDINTDVKNLAYQLKYDSTYGKLDDTITANKKGIEVNGNNITVYHKKEINDVPWDVDIVIDSSGVHSNIINARKIRGTKHCIITHSPEKDLVDKFIIMGVNEKTLREKDYLISSSICDANAFAPTINVLDKVFGVSHGFVTTLHPWLNYQNLLDGQAVSFGYPGTTYGQYELGRASLQSLIPKPTSCVSATAKVLSGIEKKFLCFSYRVPTSIVSSCDISVKLDKKVDVDTILDLFKFEEENQKYDIFHNNFEPLVSIDFAKSDYSAIIDHRWTMVNNDNYLKIVLWYDNEWGYSHRVVDLVDYLRCRYEK